MITSKIMQRAKLKSQPTLPGNEKFSAGVAANALKTLKLVVPYFIKIIEIANKKKQEKIEPSVKYLWPASAEKTELRFILAII